MIIESNVFEGCTSLVDVDISVGVAGIGAGAFAECTALTSIVIPRTVEVVGRDAFLGCDNLTIFAEADELPEGWVPTFNPDDRPIVWGAIIDITQLNTALQKYLTKALAEETYLAILDAENTYLSIDEFDDYREQIAQSFTEVYANVYSKLEADNKFLTKTGAASTYALKTELASFYTKSETTDIFLSKNDASTIYAKKTDFDAYLTRAQIQSTYLSKDDASNIYAKKTDIAAVYTYKGEVETFNDLPPYPKNGDVYSVKAAYGNYPAGTNYAWDGTKWDALGGDTAAVFAKINEINASLSAQIASKSAELQDNIDSTKADLEGQISDATSSLQEDINTAKDELQESIDESSTKDIDISVTRNPSGSYVISATLTNADGDTIASGESTFEVQALPAVAFYRHNLFLESGYNNLCEIYLSIENSDPTNYSQYNEVYDEDIGENVPTFADLSEILKYIPQGCKYLATGLNDSSGGGSGFDTIVAYVENNNNELYAGGSVIDVDSGGYPNSSGVASVTNIERVVDTVVSVYFSELPNLDEEVF